MKNIFSKKEIHLNRRRSQILVIGTIVLGLMIGVQARYIKDQSDTSANTNVEYEKAKKELVYEKKASVDLKNEILRLENENELYYEKLEQDEKSNKIAKFNKELDNAKKFAGLTDVRGPGVILTLTDAKSVPESGFDFDLASYVIHSTDLQYMINALNTAGVEAISINGERVVSTSTEICAGPTIMINKRRYAGPYVISAIGDAEKITQVLESSAIYNELRAFLDVKLERSDILTIPKYIISN